MALASYSDLQISVQRFLKRQDLSDLLPDFIMLAEASLNRQLNVTQQRTSFKITPTTNFVTLPSDLSKIIKVSYDGYPLPLIPESRTALNAAYQCDTGYSIEGAKMFLQLPSLGQVLHIEYFAKLEALSDTNPSNWLLEDAPDLYLFATLYFAADYIRDDARKASCGQMLQQLVDDLTADDADSQLPQKTPLTMRAG